MRSMSVFGSVIITLAAALLFGGGCSSDSNTGSGEEGAVGAAVLPLMGTNGLCVTGNFVISGIDGDITVPAGDCTADSLSVALQTGDYTISIANPGCTRTGETINSCQLSRVDYNGRIDGTPPLMFHVSAGSTTELTLTFAYNTTEAQAGILELTPVGSVEMSLNDPDVTSYYCCGDECDTVSAPCGSQTCVALTGYNGGDPFCYTPCTLADPSVCGGDTCMPALADTSILNSTPLENIQGYCVSP